MDKRIGRCIYLGTIEELLASLGDKPWKVGEESQ